MQNIVLSTINARYTHTSIALRYLFANLKEYKNSTLIKEFVLNQTPYEITEKILESNPKIVGLGIYIWNALETQKVIHVLKKVSPETIIVLGGPEVSHLPHRVNFDSADYIIQGEGDLAFYDLCNSIFKGDPPNGKLIQAALPPIESIELPYKYFTDEDIKNRFVYVEASRGCPFKCEFCLSSIDKSVRNIDLDKLLVEFQRLWDRGGRTFKFIDRTFNLNMKNTTRILDFFLEKKPPYLVHFEVVPDNFPEALRDKIKLFPHGSLQLEIGIQTFDEHTSENISRKQNFEKTKDNLHFLEHETNSHLHVDLIIGLPGETIGSFGNNLNLLANLTNSEIQLGILKKLSGTHISRHDDNYGMVYSDLPPYEILKNDLIPFTTMQKMKRLARFWDLTYNSGNFSKSIKMLWSDGKVYENFSAFSEWIFTQTESTWHISLERLSELLFHYLTGECELSKEEVANAIALDVLRFRGRKIPASIREHVTELPEIGEANLEGLTKRQIKRL
ncbi:MAG: B12-binding domain-containing radical SAM protein [Bacteroidetes bacterium]|nr:B12-binding domain-containing radical SAM protein [Bacteroidota bacterium]